MADPKDQDLIGDVPLQADSPELENEIQRIPTGEDYSVLSVPQKKLIIVAASFASLFSPMATAIYCKLNVPIQT
jgi:hypothetical protein